MKIKKKLIEVSLPLEAINRGCEADKNRKTGHIRNIHKWFAPMPLPAWRAMLFAALVDDPSEYAAEDAVSIERARLFSLIERLSDFNSYKDTELMNEVRATIARSVGANAPVVVDPFCGGGSTVLEAQRLGLPTFASDLNPIPVLITTILCRAAPMFGKQKPVSPNAVESLAGWAPLEGLRTDVKHYAGIVRERADKRLAALYPSEAGEVPFAYRWAWSVASPEPSAKGRFTPLVSDWWLSKHKRNRAFVRPEVNHGGVQFSIDVQGEPPSGSVTRAGARCLYTDAPIPLEYIRSEGRAGRLKPLLFAVALRDAEGNTVFRSPSAAQLAAVANVPEATIRGISMPEAALGFRVQQYGIKNFLQLFTQRQSLAMSTFAEEVQRVHRDILVAARANGLEDDERSLEDGGAGRRHTPTR